MHGEAITCVGVTWHLLHTETYFVHIMIMKTVTVDFVHL